MKKLPFVILLSGLLGAFSLSHAQGVGIGTTTPRQKLEVNGKIMVDTVSIMSPATVNLSWPNIRSAAGTVWQIPVGLGSDNTLTVIPNQLVTSISISLANGGTILTVPSTTYGGVGYGFSESYGLVVTGWFWEGCASTDATGVLSIFIDSYQNIMKVFVNGVASGTMTNSGSIYTWTSVGNGCGYVRQISFDFSTRTLTNVGGAGSLSYFGTATLYGTTF